MAHSLKHLITCRCILPQFKRMPEPPLHQFTVFSVIEDSGDVCVKHVQCNNCGIIHKVIDVCKSSIVQGREALGSIVTIDDIKVGMPPVLVNILEANNADLPTWEAVQWNLENEMWGSFVVVTVDNVDGTRQGKYVKILGKNVFKVEAFTREEEIIK